MDSIGYRLYGYTVRHAPFSLSRYDMIGSCERPTHKLALTNRAMRQVRKNPLPILRQGIQPVRLLVAI
jgi:hypothetical protein